MVNTATILRNFERAFRISVQPSGSSNPVPTRVLALFLQAVLNIP
jgi:hypothetical protein